MTRGVTQGINGFWMVLTARIVQTLTAFVALRVMTELLGPEELGRYAIIISVTTFFALIFINPAGMYVNRRLHAWDASATLMKYLKKYFLYVLAIALLAGATVALFKMIFQPLWPISTPWLAGLVILSILFTTVNQTVIPALNLLNHRGAWLILSTLTLWVALGSSIFLSLRLPSAESWQLGQLLGFAALAIVAIPVFSKFANQTSRASAEIESLKNISAFAFPLALSVGLYWAQFQSYRLFVGHWVTIELFGGFMGIYTLVAGLMSAFENLVQQYFYPRLYSESATENHEARAAAWRSFAEMAIPTIVLAGCALYAAAAPLIQFFLAPSFHAYAVFAFSAIVVETCRAVGSVYGMAGQVSYRTRVLLLPQFIAVVLLIALVPLLLSNNRFEAPMAFLISLGVPAVFYVVFSALVSKKSLKMFFSPKFLLPPGIGLLIATAFTLFANLFPKDISGAILQLVVVAITFLPLMLWSINSWKSARTGVST